MSGEAVAGRELGAPLAQVGEAENRVDQIIAHAHRLSLAATHDFPGEPVGARLVSVVTKNFG